MAHRTVFDDKDGNSLSFYINNDGLLYVEISNPDVDIYCHQFITLDMDDVVKLRDELNALIIDELNE